MPEEDFIYYGDSLNAPYGVKPLEEVRQLTYACAEHLLERGVKEIIIACNTATSAACKIMRGMYPDLPLVGIEPAVKPAAQNVCWLRKISVQIKKKGTSALRAVHPKKKHIMKRCIERQRILTAE